MPVSPPPALDNYFFLAVEQRTKTYTRLPPSTDKHVFTVKFETSPTSSTLCPEAVLCIARPCWVNRTPLYACVKWPIEGCSFALSSFAVKPPRKRRNSLRLSAYLPAKRSPTLLAGVVQPVLGAATYRSVESSRPVTGCT